MTGPEIVRGGRHGGSVVTVNVHERDQLADVATAPQGPPLILVKGPDGLLRPRQLDVIDVGEHTHPEPWGDRIRFAQTDPAAGDDAPVGAVHVNAATGHYYRKVQS